MPNKKKRPPGRPRKTEKAEPKTVAISARIPVDWEPLVLEAATVADPISPVSSWLRLLVRRELTRLGKLKGTDRAE